MFEQNTFDTILRRMMSRVPDTLDKREGSIIYDTLAPVAEELAQAYINLDIMVDESYVDSASYYGLVKRGFERGIVPIEGTRAEVYIKVHPAGIDLDIGTIFNINEMNYEVTDSDGMGVWIVTCSDIGTKGNAYAGQTVIPMEDIYGLESVEVLGLRVSGTDEEDEESFRRRYMDTFNVQSYAGNIAWYKETLTAYPSIGYCKVHPATNSGGQVFCYIADGNGDVIPQAVVDSIKNELDPTGDKSGVGIVPVGHRLELQSVELTDTVVEVPYYMDQWEPNELDRMNKEIEDIVRDYFEEKKQSWASMDEDTFRLIPLEIEGRLYSVKNLGSATVKFNGSRNTLSFYDNFIPSIKSIRVWEDG